MHTCTVAIRFSKPVHPDMQLKSFMWNCPDGLLTIQNFIFFNKMVLEFRVGILNLLTHKEKRIDCNQLIEDKGSNEI